MRTAHAPKSYTNTILTIIAVLLGLNLLARVADSPWPAAASAQPAGEPVTSPPFNSAEDRRAIIAGLDALNTRVASIESKLDKGLNVTVVKMPPVVVADSGKSEARKEPNPDTKIEVKRKP